MKAVLIRTGSAPVQSSPINGSIKFSTGDYDSVTGILLSSKNHMRSSLHLEIKDKKKNSTIRRTMSETDVIRSVNKVSRRFSESRSFPARILEDEEGALVLKKNSCDRVSEIWPEIDGLEFSGGGIGKSRNVGGGNGSGGIGGGGSLSGGNADQSKISVYYQELLKANPGNPLVLRNYGKFLHEVEGDVVRAEECYERAILASPGDGELLSLYGKLIWEIYRDGERAEVYFNQAIQANPDDCFVMGSYANFLWNAEDEEDEEEEETSEIKLKASSALIEAF